MKKRVGGFLLFSVTTIAPFLVAQQGTGSLTGQILDASGAAVAGAQVTVTNQSTNVAFTATSDATGLYVVPQLAPGIYSIAAKMSGFKMAMRPNIEVRVDDRLRIDFNLQVGAVTQTVEVTGVAPLLQTEGAVAGEVVDSQRTQELPLNGRDFLQLATLAPATVPYLQYSGNAPQGYSMSLGGGEYNNTNFLIDGMEMTALINNGPVLAPPIDSLQEFKVETNNYSADTGRLGGAAINVTVKSGSNAFHGTGYDFFRNAVLNARNALAETGPKPEFTRNQFGGSLGGAVIKNKVFFFFNYEGYRQRQYSINSTDVYTAAQKSGNFASQLGSQIGTDALGRPVFAGEIYNPFTVRQVTAGAVDPVTGLTANATTEIRDPYGSANSPTNVVTNINSISQALINIVPAPNVTNGTFPNFIKAVSSPLNYDYYVGRLDFNKSEKDQVHGFFDISNGTHNIQPTLGYPADGGCGCGSVSNQRMFDAGWTHIFTPTKINALSVAFVRNTALNSSGSGSDMSNLNPQFGIPFPFQGPYLGGMSGFDISGWTHIGTSEHDPFFQYEYKYEISDTYTMIRGSHQIKFGVWLMRQNFYNQKNCNYCRGSYNFNGTYTSQIGFNGTTGSPVADFMTGVVQGSNDGTITNEKDVFHDVEFFAQDTWHVTKKLNVTAGLRYQYNPPSWEYRGNMSSVIYGANFSNPQVVVPTTMSAANFAFMQVLFPDIPVVRATNLGQGLTTTPLKNFEPRLGIAYQLTAKTVIRTGYGIFYGYNEAVSGSILTVNPPSKELIAVTADGVNPTYALNSSSTPFGPNPFNHALLNPNFFSTRNPNWKDEFTQNWNLTVQHQLRNNWLVELGYLGSNTTHGFLNNEINDAAPLLPGQPITTPQSRRYVTPLLGNLPELTPEGLANYNGVYISVNKRFSQGLSLLANYTYSRALNNMFGISGAANTPTNGFVNPFDLRREYGPAGFDVRNHFNVSLLYELPLGHGKQFLAGVSPAVNQIIGGWQVNTITTIQGGYPTTPTLGYSAVTTFTNTLPIVVGNPYAGARVARGQWINPAAYATPTDAQILAGDYFGNAGIGSIRGPGWVDIDFSTFKTFIVREKLSIQFRVEMFNVTNTPNWGLPTLPGIPGGLGTTVGAANFGRIGLAGDPRIIQLALKFIF